MPRQTNYLRSGERLEIGDYLVSENRKFYALMQEDGTFWVYQGSSPVVRNRVVWVLGKPQSPDEYYAAMQPDCNFVVYRRYFADNGKECGDAVVATDTGGRPNGDYFALLRDDGNLCLYRGNNPATHSVLEWESPSVYKSRSYGGDGGKHGFDDYQTREVDQRMPLGKIQAITLWRHDQKGPVKDDVVAGINIEYSSGYHALRGRAVGQGRRYVLDDDEWVNSVAGYGGNYIDKLEFITNKRTITSGSGGNSFVEPQIGNQKRNLSLKSIYGRYGHVIDSVGFYFAEEERIPIRVEFLKMEYDHDFPVHLLPPKRATVVSIRNDTDLDQVFATQAEVTYTEEKTIQVRELWGWSVDLTTTMGSDFLFGSVELSLSVGFHGEQEVTNGQTISTSRTETIEFTVEVPRRCVLKAYIHEREMAFDIPWKATALVYYEHTAEPEQLALSGTVMGTKTRNFDIEYKQEPLIGPDTRSIIEDKQLPTRLEAVEQAPQGMSREAADSLKPNGRKTRAQA